MNSCVKDSCIMEYGYDLLQHMDERYTQGVDGCFKYQ
jgi:hypothetical protein